MAFYANNDSFISFNEYLFNICCAISHSKRLYNFFIKAWFYYMYKFFCKAKENGTPTNHLLYTLVCVHMC